MANKKINQLVSKTSILSTDLFPLGDGTTGQLFKKTVAELQAAIGGAVISVNGLVGTVVLDTDDIQELATPTNKYFTEARARGSISLTVSGASGASTYNSSTGVLNVPTYTLAGLGGITASFLSGGTGITYNSGTGVIAYSGTVYTDSSVRGLFSGGTGITYNSSTGAISYSGTVYTDSSIRALFSGNSPITYNSSTGAIGITGANLTEATSSVLTITGGTGALLSAASIQVKQASGSENGFLSSTDWTTFNSKQNTITNPVTGTGTTNFVTKWTSSSAVGNSQIFDNGSYIGIGTTSPDTYTQFGTGAGFTIQTATSNASTNINIVGNGTGFGGINFGNSTIRRGGIYGLDGSSLGFYTNGTNTGSGLGERLRITSAGNIGIGTDSPSNLLTLGVGTGNDVTSNTTLAITSNNQFGTTANRKFLNINFIGNSAEVKAQIQSWDESGNTGNGTLAFNTRVSGSLGERMRINTAGNVGIGTTSITSYYGFTRTLSVENSDNAEIQIKATGGTNSLISLGAASTGSFLQSGTQPLFIQVNGAYRMTLTAGGNILMGTTTDNGERLYVSGSIRATGTITANSDISLKKNLLKIENALEKVEQINGYTYEFKADDSKRHAGVIAQEIEGVLPEIVNKGNDGILGVEYGNISALLIEAIKEQQTQINELKALLNK
jgi:hypothetical protein